MLQKALARWLVLSLVFGVVTVPVLIGYAKPAAGEVGEIRFGIAGPLSGPGANIGIQLLRMWQFQIDEVNQAGGLTLGGEKYVLKAFGADDKYSAAGSRAAVEKLVYHDKIDIMLGPLSSPGNIAVQPILERENILHIAFCSTDKIMGREHPMTFKLHTAVSLMTFILVNWVQETHPEIKTMSLLATNDETGWSDDKWTQKAIDLAEPAKKLKYVAKEFYDRGQVKDFNPILTKILRSKPDLINLDTMPEAMCGLVAKQARELGYNGRIMSTTAFTPTMIAEIAGKENAEGFWSCATDIKYRGWPEGMYELARRYGKKHPGKPIGVGWLAVNMVPSLVSAIKLADSPDVSAIRNALERRQTWHAPMGEMSWGGKEYLGIKHQINQPVPIAECKNGRFVQIDIAPGRIP